MWGWFADYPDPQQYSCVLWTTRSPSNQIAKVYPLESVPEADALCAQADTLQDETTCLPLYQQAEQLLVNQVAAMPLYQYKATYVVRSRVVGWRLAPTGMTPLSVWQMSTSSANSAHHIVASGIGIPSRRIS
jgi:peptide/nickel transport system substrate-binding protein/oligopeptide transport system substrate-binding protein